MNAPARIPAPRDRYIPQVQAFVPQCEGDDLKLRCSILLVRDQATAGLRRAGWEAASVLCAVERLAGQYAYATMPTDRLRDLRYQLVRLMTCATGIEMFAHSMEGAHEGG